MLGLTAPAAKPFADTPLIISPTSSNHWSKVTLVHHSGSWHFSSPLPVRSCLDSSTNIRRSQRHPASSSSRIAPASSLPSRQARSRSLSSRPIVRCPALPKPCLISSRQPRPRYHHLPPFDLLRRPHFTSRRYYLPSAVVSAAAVLIQSFPRSLNPLERFPRRSARPP